MNQFIVVVKLEYLLVNYDGKQLALKFLDEKFLLSI